MHTRSWVLDLAKAFAMAALASTSRSTTACTGERVCVRVRGLDQRCGDNELVEKCESDLTVCWR